MQEGPRRPALRIHEQQIQSPSAADAQLIALCRKIERERGFFCANYKDTCLRRRLSVRMRVKGATTYAAYSLVLDDDPLEYDRLIATLTINVSKFFRNPDIYQAIEELVLPAVAKSAGKLVRIWSAGCAAGEETYSLAALCAELARKSGSSHPIHFDIVGTDVDANVISAAREGVYADSEFSDTPPDIRDRYFPISGGMRSVSPALRRLVTFHHTDLLDTSRKPAPFHLIVCRNVIIYFERETQQWLFKRFHDLLRPDGFLVLGKVESLLGKSRELFTPVSPRERIYQRA